MKPDRLKIYEAKRGLLRRRQWRARVVAGNGKTLFSSSEGYNNLKELLAICDRLFPHLQREGV